jgi:hypothetical protein
MKRIVDYNMAWDSQAKLGYFTAIDEQQQSHIFENLSQAEFSLLQGMLKENRVYIDQNRWIITGWNTDSSV